MWEKETIRGKQIMQMSTWSMVFSFSLVFTTCFFDSLIGYLANMQFLPAIGYTIKDIIIGLSVALLSGVWIFLLKRFPSSRVLKIASAIVVFILCYPLNFEVNMPSIGIAKATYS